MLLGIPLLLFLDVERVHALLPVPIAGIMPGGSGAVSHRDRRDAPLIRNGLNVAKGSGMFKKPNCPVIAVEEHYWDAELAKTYVGLESGRPGPQMERLFDLGALRLKEMDEAGIDMQVISHGAPSAQKLPADGAAALVRGVNDRLAAACAANPEALRRLRALPIERSEGRRRRARAHA